MEKLLKAISTIVLFIISVPIQLFVLNDISVFGVKPNLLLISVIIISLYNGIYASTIYSFVLGIMVDLMFGGKGIFTISYVAIGMLLGFVNEDYMKENYLSILILTSISVTLFEVVQYFENIIMIKSFISLFILFKQIIFGIILNGILVFIMCFLFSKITGHIDKKQNKMYW